MLYSATDGQLKSSATATIKVASNAPLRSPVARDDFVEAEVILDPETLFVDVDVLANDSDPDGSTNDLEVAIDGTYEDVELRGEDGTVRVVPQEEQQRIRYIITDVDGLESAGYIWVPGTAKQAPVWVGPPLEVQAGSEGTIDLADPNNVRVRPGAESVQITDPGRVTAVHSDGSQLVEDESTLVYRPADGFSGKDTITAEVTDGAVGDPSAATASLAIPVEVAPEETNLPPTFQGARLEVEQGGPSSTLDLSAGAEDPEDDTLDYALGEYEANPEITLALDGASLTASATSKAAKGTVVEVPVTVTDGTNPAVSASVELTVAGSQRPEISTALDEEEIDAGRSKTIDVLANDSNPFPGGERTLTGASIVSGDGDIAVEGNQVTITPDPSYHGILTAQYGVLDDTGDPEREVSGEIRVTVRGLPEAPSAPRIGEVGDGFVELTFNAGADNGAPITGYTVSTASGPAVTQDCASTSCTITGLSNDTEYTFQVIATNDVGTSDPSVASAVARPDVRPEKPAAPSVQRGDEQLTVGWTPPVNRGSAIQTYEVQLQNTSTQEITAQEISGGTTQTVFPGLVNGVDYRFRVRASNLAEEPSDWSEWSRPEHPAGKPTAPAGNPSAERVNDPRGGGVEVTWPEMTTAEANGEPITDYIVTASSGKSLTVDASKTSTTFLGLDPDTAYTFTYTGVNSVGRGADASGASNKVTPWAKPFAPTGVKATMPSEGKGDGPNGRATVHWNAADGNGTTVTKYVVRWNGGSKTVDASKTSLALSGLRNGTSYRFTVEARNGFAKDGGVSPRSDESTAVTPYTTPDRPTISSTSSKCSGANSCPVSFTFTAHDDGGGAGRTIHYRVGGGDYQTTTNGKITVDKQIKAGTTIEAEAYVSIDEGLKSPTAAKSQKAQSWQKTPKFSKVNWGSFVPPGTEGCSNNNCKWFRISLQNMTPGETYRVAFSNEGETRYKTIKMTANSNGTATSAAGSNFYGYVRGGEPDWPMTVEVEVNGRWVKVADGIYRPY
ncbi:fibronectin type III domain-containing protein [Brachybacterium avium]|uniref:fibronectin type III domain-containing protein n=1 Tax=Brachybacterium avium TaxID=2017485 RepID=UPI001FE343F6|nr:fibronectin type III domain-containing protein [Brachybacterium avium]